jgi:hypothetical protein
MCPVLTGRSRGPADLGVIGGRKPVFVAFPGRLGRRLRMAIICNSPLPAGLSRPWRQKKEEPLPTRIQIISACQTRQDLNRMLEKPVQKWTGCPRTPLGPTTGDRPCREPKPAGIRASLHEGLSVFQQACQSQWILYPPRDSFRAPRPGRR